MRLIDVLCVSLAVFSGLILLSIIGLTFVDVVLRYILSAPIFGARDILEMGMVVVISLAFPFTWRMGGHIVVDLIPDYNIAALTITRDLVVRAIGSAMFGMLAWRCWIRANDAVLFNEATNMIELPFSPFFIFLAAASVLQTFVLIIESVFLIMRMPIANTVASAKPLEDAPSTE